MLFSELDNLSYSELVDCFEGPPVDGEEYALGWYEEVADCLRESGDEGISFLFEQVETVDPVRLAAVLVVLTGPPTVVDSRLGLWLPGFLSHPEHVVVMAAVDGLSTQEDTHQDEVMALRDHPDPYVRGSVLRFISRVLPQEAIPFLIDALNDPHYIVRENAIDELDELGASYDVVPRLRTFLDDPHPDVRQAAATAICNVELWPGGQSQLASPPDPVG